MAWMALGELFAILFGLALIWSFLIYRDPVTGRRARGLMGRPKEPADEAADRDRQD